MKPEIVISLAASVLSICAIGISIWQGYLMRRHNRISVKPLLAFQQNYKKVSESCGLVLVNQGLGTAIINDIRVYVNNDYIGLLDSNDTWERALLKTLPGGTKYSSKVLDGKYPLIAGDKITLLEFTEQNVDDKAIRKCLRSLEMEVRYESLYGTKFIDFCNK